MTPRPSTPLSPLERIRFPSGKTSSSREADVPPPPSSFCYEFELERVPKKKRQSSLPSPRSMPSNRNESSIASSNQLRFFKTRVLYLERISSTFALPSSVSFFLFFPSFFFSLSLPLTSEVIKRGGVSLISTILFPPPPPSLLSLSFFTMFHVCTDQS